mgnify:CR=1 FL=1
MNYTITNFIARFKESATGTMANGCEFKSCLYYTDMEWRVQVVYFEIEEDGCRSEVANNNLFQCATKGAAKSFLMNYLGA